MSKKKFRAQQKKNERRPRGPVAVPAPAAPRREGGEASSSDLAERLCDLRFVIGLFLCTIGLIVLGSYLFGPDDRVQGVHVNLIGASLLIGVGLPLGASAFLGWRPRLRRMITGKWVRSLREDASHVHANRTLEIAGAARRPA